VCLTALLAVWLGWALTGLPALAQAGPTPATAATAAEPGNWEGPGAPSVETDEAEFRFGESLAFRLDASAGAAIEDVVLHYIVGTDGPRNRRIPEFNPGERVAARHEEHVSRGQIPPTTQITWWWTLTDGDGRSIETAPQTRRYEDSRFEWRRTPGEDVVVWWYGAPESFGADLESKARAALADLGQRIGTDADRPIHIVTYQSREDMLGALVDRGDVFESRLSTLGARVAPDILLLLAGSDNPELDEVLRHELSHVVLHLHLGKDYLDVPAWLDEGLAMVSEGDLNDPEQGILDDAIRSDGLQSLRSLTTFPGRAELVPLAYSQSRDVVAWLLADQGSDDFRRLLDTLKTGQLSADEALVAVYGKDQTQLYQAYRAARGLGPAATPEPGALERSSPGDNPIGVRSEGSRNLARFVLAAMWCCLLGLLLASMLFMLMMTLLRRARGSPS
jgi:hypothetical protein